MDKNKRFLYIKAIWMLFIAIITILLINIFSIARYTSSTEGTTELSIAKPILEMNLSSTQLNNLDMNNQEIQFSVKNYNSSNSNGVALNYKIKLVIEGIQEGEKPFEFKLYKIENENRVECQLSNDYISDVFYMPHTEQATDNFVLSTNVEQSEYQNNSYQLKIVLDSEQVI